MYTISVFMWFGQDMSWRHNYLLYVWDFYQSMQFKFSSIAKQNVCKITGTFKHVLLLALV